MSSPSIKPPTSPPTRWLSNDEDGRSGLSAERGQLGAVQAQPNDGPQERAPSYPPADHPVDENLFYSAPSQPMDAATEDEDHNDATDAVDTYQEPETEELLPPSDFRPFFNLIEDPKGGEYHHPIVHYIFSDDDPEILTSAALDSLDRYEDGQRQGDDIDERCIIVDITVDGKTVASASSMSPQWQALKTTVTPAPSWGDNTKDVDRGLMLKVSGQETSSISSTKSMKKRAHDIEGLVKTFSSRLDSLEDVLGKGLPLTDEVEAAERSQ